MPRVSSVFWHSATQSVQCDVKSCYQCSGRPTHILSSALLIEVTHVMC